MTFFSGSVRINRFVFERGVFPGEFLENGGAPSLAHARSQSRIVDQRSQPGRGFGDIDEQVTAVMPMRRQNREA